MTSKGRCKISLLLLFAIWQLSNITTIAFSCPNQANCDYSELLEPAAGSWKNATTTTATTTTNSFDYSSLLSDEELAIEAAAGEQQLEQQQDRLLWRRQATSGDNADNAGNQLESLLSSPDYDFYRPLSDFSGSGQAEPAGHFKGYVQQQRLFMEPKEAVVGKFEATSNKQQAKMGPQFIIEPASYIHYLNSSELVIHCSASGNPQPTISWWHRNSQLEIGSLLDKRYVRYDNSLVISAFKGHDYEPDIHSTTYKCQASNSLGTIISRDVVINAVIDQDYEVSVADQFVTVDNDALFKCQLPVQLRDVLQVIGWLEDGQHLIQASAGSSLPVGPGSQQQQQQSLQLSWPAASTATGSGSARPLMLPEGQLYVPRVQLKDANKSYRCQVKNLLNSKVTLSSISGRLFVTDASEQSGSPPRIVDGPKSVTLAKFGPSEPAASLLACLAQGSPRPQMRWFEFSPARADWVEIGPSGNDSRNYVISADGNLLLVRHSSSSSSSQTPSSTSGQRANFRPRNLRIKCLANNSFGQHQMETELRLEPYPAQSRLLELEPSLEYINNNNNNEQQPSTTSMTFNCTIRASSLPVLAIEWLRNGKLLFSLALPQFAAALQPTGSGLDMLLAARQATLAGQSWLLNGSGLLEEPGQELRSIEFYGNREQLTGESSSLEEPVELLSNVAGSNEQSSASGSGYAISSTSLLKMASSPESNNERRLSQRVLLVGASLKCVASGSPLPEISWSLSGFPVPESSRFRVGDYVTRDGLIVSFVNITGVQPEDGGLYECSATNDVGQLRHAAWLNVTGPPSIRPMGNVAAVAGRSLSIMCPVGGWPIESIGWFQNSSKLPVNHRQKIFPNGSLIISELNEATDSGQYSCQARGPTGSGGSLAASEHVQVSIKVPPVVEPFAFAKSLHRGQRYNLMCTVVHGDLPVSIRWFKDGRPLDDSASNSDQQQQVTSANEQEGIAIKHLDPYSSTLTFASLQLHHRGLYSCEAANEAGRANQSSALVIHVPPEWRVEPKDLSVTVGRTAVIDCQADGFPAARIEWRLSQDLFREPPSEFKPIISSLYMRVFENGSLIIYNAQRSDAGYYLCQAANGVGPGLSRVIKLTVHVAAHFKSKIRTEVVRRGQPARLKCDSIGDLPIEINWLKDKLPVYAGSEELARYSISKTLLQDGITSELNIAETDRLDSALFTCITQNAFGNDDTNIQLIVQGPPDPPQEIRIHEYEARSVKISWLPGYAGNSPLIRYVLMFAPSSTTTGSELAGRQLTGNFVNVSISGNESSALLQNLVPLTEYQFYLFAVNQLGSSRLQNEPIKFKTDDEAPNAPPLFVKAQAASSRSIWVRWRAPERRVHYGAISGFYVGYKPSGSSQTGRPLSTETFIYKTVEFDSISNRSSLQNPNELECLLTGLRRGQKYVIIVQAFNGRGAGPASEAALAETWRVDVPEPPSLRMVGRSAHSIHLAWRLAGGLNIPTSATSAGNAKDSMRKSINEHIKAALTLQEQPNTGSSPSSSKSAASSSVSTEVTESISLADAELAQANEPILGFILTRKQVGSTTGNEPPVELRLPSDHLSQIVDGLACGTRYQFTIAALNSVGSSQPSEPLLVKTDGSAPVAPERGALLSMNSSSVVVNLAAWHNGACAMKSFELAFKPSRAKKWTPLTSYQLAESPVNQVNESASQLVQRSAGSGSSPNQLLANNTNSLIVLDELSNALNYDLKIVATNEAGSTEAVYTFNTNNGLLSGPSGRLQEGELQWATGSSQLSEVANFSELLAQSGSLLPWLLFLLLLSVGLTSGCILIAKRRHNSSSNCSLSLSSASRSNQSSSNYYTTTAADSQNGTTATIKSRCATLNQAAGGQLRQEEPIDETGNGLTRLGERIYAARQLANNHLLLSEPKATSYSTPTTNYASQLRPPSPPNTDLASLVNGSEAEMCLGASALNLATGSGQRELPEVGAGRQQRSDSEAAANYAFALKQNQQVYGVKSSTLPANCHHHQLIQQLLQQQQPATAQPEAAPNQQILDTLMAVNMLQQQQQHCNQPDNYFQQQQQQQQPGQAEMVALLEQQLQQQVYATVKRGCPRPPRPCDYTIYQCPTGPNSGGPVNLAEGGELSNFVLCCPVGGEMAPQQQGNNNTSCYLAQQQQDHNCLHQQTSQLNNQSDYQQLRPAPIKLD